MSGKRCFELLMAGILLSAANIGAAADDKQAGCHVGTYHFANRPDVDIGPGEEGKLRWRRHDGTTGELTRAGDGSWTSTLGWTGRADGIRVVFAACGSEAIRFDGVAGKRVAFDVTETRFAVEDADLVGRLLMPKGTGTVPIVVLIHGSENDSARDYYALQRQFPSAGIGAFVYDKRGTGGSTGEYTQDYLTLAVDAIAAMREAKRLAGHRAGRVGYQGGSQGGWVAPLAARIEPVDFVVVGFGLAISPLQEDRSAIALDVTRHLRVLGPKLFPGVPLHYDPQPVLRNLTVPQLWILGEDDADAPSAETARRLRELSSSGHPVSVAVFPHAEHGIYEYETAADGQRLSTRQPEGYFRMMRDFILGKPLEPQYGTATLTRGRGQ
jgi:pimeloyl-ACP methyl ester carboxylesterase